MATIVSIAGALPRRQERVAGASWWRRRGVGLLLPAAILLLWTVAAQQAWMPATVLPSPALVARSFVDLVASGELIAHLAVSLRRVAIAFVIGTAIGLAIGVALGSSRTVDTWFGPFFRTFAQIPSLTWIPLLMMALGIGETLKIVVLAKACLVPVAITTAGAIREVSIEYLEVGRILRLSRLSTFAKILFPATFPAVFSGLRQGLSGVWTALIVVEMMASANGLGYLMSWARMLFQLDIVMVAIVTVGLIGFGLDLVLKTIDLRLQGWRA